MVDRHFESVPSPAAILFRFVSFKKKLRCQFMHRNFIFVRGQSMHGGEGESACYLQAHMPFFVISHCLFQRLRRILALRYSMSVANLVFRGEMNFILTGLRAFLSRADWDEWTDRTTNKNASRVESRMSEICYGSRVKQTCDLCEDFDSKFA